MCGDLHSKAISCTYVPHEYMNHINKYFTCVIICMLRICTVYVHVSSDLCIVIYECVCLRSLWSNVFKDCDGDCVLLRIMCLEYDFRISYT